MAVKTQEANAKAVTTIGIRKNLMSADGVFTLATWIGVVALGIGVVCACAIAISGKIRDDRLTLALAESAQKTADAELKLAQLRKLAGPRGINLDTFKKELEGKPKHSVQIWYLPDLSDGWSFSFRLQVALLQVGWQADDPVEIPAPDPNNLMVRNMPRAVVAGGQPWGITVVGDFPMGSTGDNIKDDSSYLVLLSALAKSTDFGMQGSSGSQFSPVPKGMLRVVVAAKADPIFMDNPPNVPATTNQK